MKKNLRSQRITSIWLDVDTLAELRKNVPKGRRGQFIRDAIRARLSRLRTHGNEDKKQ